MPADHRVVYVILEIMVISIGLTSAWTLWATLWMTRIGLELRMKKHIEEHVQAEFTRRGWYLAPAERARLHVEEPQCAFRWPSGERCVTRRADHHPGLQHDYMLPANADPRGSGP